MILNSINSTRIALFILCVIGFQMFSDAQTLNTIRNGTPGSGVWMGNNGLTGKGDDCYRITTSDQYQGGAVWYNHPINFNNPFTISYQAYFGDNQSGADGMALVFKNNNNNVLGETGKGIGYGGIPNSMSFEFDTFWNSDKGDPRPEPNEDHVAFNWLGDPNHNTSFISSVQSVPNIEDDAFHEVKVTWEPAPVYRLRLYLDCEIKISMNGMYGLQNYTNHYFGFTGSTGANTNAQYVCFNSISFVEGLNIPDTTICEGITVTSINALTPSGTSYSWSPTTGVSNPNISNPTFTPTTTTTYTVSISDVCGDVTTEDVTINVLSSALPTFAAVDAICNGDVLAPLPTTSLEGFPGTWSPALNNTITTTYTFRPTSCSAPTMGGVVVYSRLVDLTIVVNQQVNPLFTAVADICNGDVLAPLPTISNDGITGTWSPALDNTTTTLYTFTPTAGLCANPATLTITVIPITDPTFTAVDAICNGDFLAALPTTSNNGVSGTWSPALDNTTTTTYTFTPNADECADPTTMTVVVVPVNVLTISAINLSEEFDTNQVISVTVSGGSGSYEYQLDNGLWQFSSVFEYVTGCDEHTVVVRDAIDTCNTEPETTVSIMEYPKFFTPNGDGFNDTWNIKCLKDNPLARIRIFDRYGKLLLDFRPSQNAWNGTFNGQRLPGSDYWFVANYLKSNGVEAQFRSHFSLRY